jgi:catechol 2,3-dioxygenase
MIRSNVHFVRLATANLPAMVGWYAKVFNMAPSHWSSPPEGARRTLGLSAAWSSNHHVNPRITLLSLSGSLVEPCQSRLLQPQHITFECATLDELLNAYVRLKGLGIEPLRTIRRGTSTTLCYEDPDQNLVELRHDAGGSSPRSSDDTRATHHLEKPPTAAHVDPERMMAARTAGMSVNELHQRVFAGEFLPLNSMEIQF